MSFPCKRHFTLLGVLHLHPNFQDRECCSSMKSTNTTVFFKWSISIQRYKRMSIKSPGKSQGLCLAPPRQQSQCQASLPGEGIPKKLLCCHPPHSFLSHHQTHSRRQSGWIPTACNFPFPSLSLHGAKWRVCGCWTTTLHYVLDYEMLDHNSPFQSLTEARANGRTQLHTAFFLGFPAA